MAEQATSSARGWSRIRVHPSHSATACAMAERFDGGRPLDTGPDPRLALTTAEFRFLERLAAQTALAAELQAALEALVQRLASEVPSPPSERDGQ